MASLTLTFSQFQDNVVATHTGVIPAGGALSVSATVCASSVLNLVKVPNNCTLLDFWMKIQTGGADQTIEIGTSNTPSGIMQITTLTRTYSLSVGTNEEINLYGTGDQGWVRAPGGTIQGTSDLMPVRISLSDDAQPSTVWVQGRVTAACSASAFFTFCLFYTMDGFKGHTTIR